MREIEARPPQVKVLLKELFRTTHKTSIFLKGDPGIGKSTVAREVAEELAQELNLEFVDYADQEAGRILAAPDKFFIFRDLRLTEVEPTDLGGIPREEQDYDAIAFRPLLWARCLSVSPGLLVLDEFNHVQRKDVESASFKLVFDRKAGDTRFHPNVMVIAAGNEPESSTIANLLPAPLADRFTFVRVVKPELHEWAAWMDSKYPEWDRRILGYLRHFPEDFLKVPEDPQTLTNFPTPRSWTNLANLFPEVSASLYRIIADGELGPDIGVKVEAYLKTNVPPIEDLIKQPQLFRSTKLGEDGRYLAASMLGSWLREAVERGKVKDALPLCREMSDVTREYLAVSVLATGEKRNDVLRELLKDSEIRKWLQEMATLRAALEVL